MIAAYNGIAMRKPMIHIDKLYKSATPMKFHIALQSGQKKFKL